MHISNNKMIVTYRMCDIASTNPSPILQDNKFALNELCLKSFVLAFRDVKPKMIFICDFCPETYTEMIDRIVPFEHEIKYTTLGIDESARQAYREAEKTSDDIILFSECDYVYRPSVGGNMAKAIAHFGLFSPYDHPNFYTAREFHSAETTMELYNNEHFRTTERNTMTFGMTREVFEKQYEILMKWGYLDGDVWHEMRANGNPLWTPIPGYATHMVEGLLSPAIPWENIFNILA